MEYRFHMIFVLFFKKITIRILCQTRGLKL